MCVNCRVRVGLYACLCPVNMCLRFLVALNVHVFVLVTYVSIRCYFFTFNVTCFGVLLDPEWALSKRWYIVQCAIAYTCE